MKTNIKSAIFTLSFALVTIFNSIAEAAPLTIRGSASCGNWIEERSSSDRLSSIINLRWLIGYMSGYSVAKNIDVLKGTDNDSINLWMDNYCKANPLKRIDDGADVLIEELKRQKGLR